MDMLQYSPSGMNLVLAWFGTTLTTLIFTLFLLIFLATPKVVEPVSSDFKLYAALPASTSSSSDEINFQDGRTKIIENFFQEHHSPLADNAGTFIKVADKYQLDWRLLPAISMQESNGGKRIIPSSKNPFGYGIYGDKVLKFANFDEAIERVGKGLKEDYIDQGLKTPNQIMAKYTPSSLSIGGTWAKGVVSFMEDIR